MAAVRFKSEFTSDRGIDHTIEIWDTEYTGDPTAFTVADDGYTIGYSAEGGERIPPFMCTKCGFSFKIENETHFALINDFADAQEGRFLVRAFQGDDVEWTGVILLDLSSYQEAPFPFDFDIRATDGLGALKKIPYKDADDNFYTGKAKMIEFVMRILSRITYVPTFYETGEVLLRTSVDWWEETMTQDSEDVDMLDQAYVDNAAYYKYDKGIQQVQSCWEVLYDMLVTTGSRITYADGAFWIEQLSYRRSAIIVQRRWDKEASFMGAVNYNSTNPITQTLFGALKAGGQYEFQGPPSEARHTFYAKERRNFFAGAQNVTDTHVGIDTFNVPIHANNGATTLRMTGNLLVRIKSLISEPGYTAPLAPFVAVIRINLFLDTVGLQRLYTLQTAGYQVAYSPSTWNATPGCYVIQPFSGIFLQNTTDDVYTFPQTIDIVTPPLPENTESFTFSMVLESLKYYNGDPVTASDFTITYELSNLWLEAWSEGGPVLSGDGDIFYTKNTDTQNTLVNETEGYIGSSTNPNTVGAMWVKPGADYVLAGLWGVGSDTPGYSFIGQMLTAVVAGSHAKPARKLNGELYGNIKDLARVVWDSENWILLGGEYAASQNTFSGEWLEMKPIVGLTPSAPIKFTAYPDPTPPNTNTDVPGGSGPFRLGAPLGSIWYAIASTLSDENLRAGTPGTIAIQNTLAQYDFNAGDHVAIINPFSGEFEELEITTTTTDGETAIAVTGDLVGNYPVGSPIVRIPRIGGPFSMPGGVDGQIMLFVTDRWRAGNMVDSSEIDFTYNAGTKSITAVLKTTGVAGGTYNSVTVDSKGRITAATFIAYLTANQTITLSGDATGSGTTAIAVTIANGAVTLAKMANMATASFLGRNTAGAGSPEVLSIATAKTMLGLSGTNSGDQTITLTGDVTGSGTGSFAAAIANAAVTLAKMADIITASFLGRNTAGTGTPEVLSIATAKTMLGLSGTNSGDQTITLTGDVTGSGTGSFAATIAANAVTLAKMAQVATAIFLGRTTAGTGNVEAMTVTQATALLNVFSSSLKGLAPASGGGTANYLRADGTWAAPPGTGITGSGTAGQVPVFTAAAVLAGFVSFLYDSTNFRLQINGSGSAVTPTARIDIRMGVVTGNDEAFRYSAQVSGGLMGILGNTRNVSGTGNAIMIVQVGGTAAGDAVYQAVVPGGETWTWGVDNSDADKFKLRPQTTLAAGATGGEGLTITADVTPLVGINTDTPGHPLDVNGQARALTWTNRTDATGGTHSFGTGAGGSPSLTALVCPNGNMMTVRFTSGTSPVAGARIINIIPPATVRHANKVYAVIQGYNDVAQRDIAKFVIDTSATTPANIAIKSNSLLAGIDAGTDYFLCIIIMGHA